jgi:hypothetical protein
MTYWGALQRLPCYHAHSSQKWPFRISSMVLLVPQQDGVRPDLEVGVLQLFLGSQEKCIVRYMPIGGNGERCRAVRVPYNPLPFAVAFEFAGPLASHSRLA